MSTRETRPGLGFVEAILSGLARLGTRARQAADTPDGPGYETSDVHVGNTLAVMAGLALAAVTAVGAMIGLMHLVAADQRRALPRLTPQQTARIAPPAPNLQADPYADREAQRAAEAARLDGYAFTDATRRRARIPIDRAMALTVGRTLDP